MTWSYNLTVYKTDQSKNRCQLLGTFPSSSTSELVWGACLLLAANRLGRRRGVVVVVVVVGGGGGDLAVDVATVKTGGVDVATQGTEPEVPLATDKTGGVAGTTDFG